MRSHPTDSLKYPGLANFSGPALCAFNDATFTEEDFKNIQRVGDSSKQTARGKVGRFGVGFNAVCES
jgi:sacsin